MTAEERGKDVTLTKNKGQIARRRYNQHISLSFDLIETEPERVFQGGGGGESF